MSTSESSPSSSVNTIWDWNFVPNKDCAIDIEKNPAAFSHEEAQLVSECLTPDRKSAHHPAKTMFVLGDCHVGVLLPGLALATRGSYQIRHIQADTTSIFPHVQAGSTNPNRFVDFYTTILSTLHREFSKDDVIVIAQYAGNWNDETMDMSEGASAIPAARNKAVAATSASGKSEVAKRSDTDRYLTPLPLDLMERDLLEGIVEPKHGRLFVFGEWPYFQNLGPGGLFGGLLGTFLGGGEGDVHNQAYLHENIQPMLKRHRALNYHSLLPLFCEKGTELDTEWADTPQGACGINIPGTDVQAYSNENHLNTMGSIYLWPFLCDAFHGDGGPE
jgi:hypothetical protein